MVVGGPRLDCPTSASTMAIRRSCTRSILANHVRKVVIPVSVAPRSKIVRACRGSSNAAFQLGCSINLATVYTFPSLEPTMFLLALVCHSTCSCWMHNRGGVSISHLIATGGSVWGTAHQTRGLRMQGRSCYDA